MSLKANIFKHFEFIYAARNQDGGTEMGGSVLHTHLTKAHWPVRAGSSVSTLPFPF